jgi:hypothetical protein
MRKFAASIGDNVLTSFDVAHNLGTRDVIVQVRRNVDPYDVVDVDIAIKGEDVITVSVNVVMGIPPIDPDALRVVVIG